MTPHLTPEDLVARLDRTLPATRAAHLQECGSCRRALADLEASMSLVQSASDAPEPSPLFWEHLSDRVRTATADAPVQGASIWWRPLTALGVLAAAVLVVVVARTAVQPATSRTDAAVVSTESSDDAAWQAMAEAASTLSSDDVRVAVALVPEAPLVTDLTPEQRQAFVLLLGREMGGLE